ncbi:substrate-binding domain-containing protein [Flindersiella endophytica]
MIPLPRHSKRIVSAVLAGVGALALAAACASTPTAGPTSSSDSKADGGKKQFVVGYSQSNNAEPYRAQLNKQLEYFVAQYPDLKLLDIADAQQDSGKQVSHVQQFVQQKVDVLIVSPNEAAPLTAAVQQACDAGIPVIILDRTVNTDCYSAFIGGDNYVAGKKAGELAVQLLPSGGNVVELQGILSNQPQIDRDKGFRDAIKANPKIKIIDHREAKWLKEEATKVMDQWLARGLSIDLVYAENDPMALGAYLSATAKRKQNSIKFIGTDGLAIAEGGIRAVQQGKLAGSFIYPTGAEEAAKAAEALANGKTVQKKQVLDIQAVTPENAAKLYEQYDFSDK